MTDYEPLSPLDVEAKLRGLVNDMSAAQKALREARDAETEDGGREGVCECCSTCSPETGREAPADRRDLPAVDAPRPSVQTSQPAGVALPACDAHPGYVMRLDTVALHFPIDAVPALAELLPSLADALHAAALDVEMEAESQQDAREWKFA